MLVLCEIRKKIAKTCVPFHSIDYGSEIDPDLHDLFDRILERDPDKRITMQELRVGIMEDTTVIVYAYIASIFQEHPWVTNHGKQPLISEEENCEMVVTEVTEEDINNAISSIASIFTIVSSV